MEFRGAVHLGQAGERELNVAGVHGRRAEQFMPDRFSQVCVVVGGRYSKSSTS